MTKKSKSKSIQKDNKNKSNKCKIIIEYTCDAFEFIECKYCIPKSEQNLCCKFYSKSECTNDEAINNARLLKKGN